MTVRARRGRRPTQGAGCSSKRRCAALANGGIDRLSTRTIAAEAGVSVGLINHHYPSKDALDRGRLSERRGRSAGRAAGGGRGRARGSARGLSAFFRDSFSPRVLDPKLLKIWTGFWTTADASPEVRAAHDQNYAQYRALLEDAALRFVGPRQRASTSALAAIGLSALLDGLWLEWCLNPETFTPDEAIRHLRDVGGRARRGSLARVLRTTRKSR